MARRSRVSHLMGRAVFPARALPAEAFKTDCHLHTCWTDGRSTVAEMLAAAARSGLEAIAFTEHVRRGCTWFEAFRAEVEREARAYPRLTVWVGCEAKALDFKGGLDVDPSLIAQSDLVLGAVHGFPDGRGGFVDPAALTAREAAWLERDATLGLIDHPEVDVIAHVGALTRRRYGEFPRAFEAAIVAKASRAGKVIELNGEYMTPADLARLLANCRAEGARVSLGSNAHELGEVGRIGGLLTEAAAHAG